MVWAGRAGRGAGSADDAGEGWHAEVDGAGPPGPARRAGWGYCGCGEA